MSHVGAVVTCRGCRALSHVRCPAWLHYLREEGAALCAERRQFGVHGIVVHFVRHPDGDVEDQLRVVLRLWMQEQRGLAVVLTFRCKGSGRRPKYRLYRVQFTAMEIGNVHVGETEKRMQKSGPITRQGQSNELHCAVQRPCCPTFRTSSRTTAGE